MLLIYSQPVPNRLFFVVFSLDELPPAAVTNPFLFRRHILHVVDIAALGANASSTQTGDNNLIGNLEVYYGVDAVDIRKRLRLRDRPRKSIEDVS